MKIGDYAFWNYDKYPHFRGGKIIGINSAKKGEYQHGTVEIEKYGKGYWWPVRFSLKPSEGEALLRDIEGLEEWHTEQCKDLGELFNHRLNATLDIFSVPKIYRAKI